ncbi:MAG: murein biosynthesis integral membrane protein MurJ [Chloroflexota bacterium]
MKRRGASLALASAILMASFVASRATGLLREIVISGQFGTSGEYAAYLAAMRIPDFVFQVIAGGAVGSAFIPVFTGYLARGEDEEGWRVVSTIFNLAIIFMSPIVVLLMVFSPQVIALLTPSFPPELLALAANIAHILLVLPLLFALGVLSTSVLQSFNQFLLAALAPVLYNVGLILGALILGPSEGIYGLALGAVGGAVAYLLVQIPGLLRRGIRYRPTLDLRHPGVREVGRLMAPRTFGLAVYQVNFVIVLYLASPTPERVPALNYAWQLTMMPLGIFAMAISTAVFPTLAEQSALNLTEELKRTVSSALRLIMFLTIPAMAGLIVLQIPIVRLLFERDAFTPESTLATAYALQFYALGLVGLAGVEITTRAFYALHDTRTPVIIATLAMLLHLGLSLFLVRTPLGYGGLALSMSLSSLAEAGVLLLMAQRRLGGLAGRVIMSSFMRSTLASTAMVVVLTLLAAPLAPYTASPSNGQRLLGVTIAVAAGGAAYLVAALALRSPELQMISALLRRRVRGAVSA